ncbi:MAG: class sortase [Aeromicrobium sp.]|nr:class sortase [Aeromicrobium sp.]
MSTVSTPPRPGRRKSEDSVRPWSAVAGRVDDRVRRTERAFRDGRRTRGGVIGLSLLVPGIALIAFLGYVLGWSQIEAHRSQDLLYDQFRTQLATAVAPVNGAIPPGTPVAILKVKKLNLEQVVVQGSASEQTKVGPGLKSDSALPGQAGVSVIVGRRVSFGGPFRHLDDLRTGDVITVTTGQGRFTYTVDLVRTTDAPPTSVKASLSRLTLITSSPAYAPNRKLLVSAALAGTPSAKSTVTEANRFEAPNSGSTAKGVALLLWAQLLILALAAATWAWLKYPKTVVWVGAAPIVAAVTLHIFSDLAGLLPNTL